MHACLQVRYGRPKVSRRSSKYPQFPSHALRLVDIIQNTIVKAEQEAIASYKDGAKGYPDPAFVYQLPDEAYTGSNLFAVQKHYDGPFQFDVFFESASAKQKLSCQSNYDRSCRSQRN